MRPFTLRCIMTKTRVRGVPQVAGIPPGVLTPYGESAAQFVAALNAAIALIPVFVPKHPETVKFVQRYISFSDKLITSTVAAVEDSPELQVFNKFDVRKARAAYQFNAAFKPTIDMVDQLSTNLKFTCQFLKAATVADCLQTLQIAKGIGRDPSSAGVAAHVRNMKRNLRRPARRTKKTAKSGAAKIRAGSKR
jgi:hypothetical protein